MKMIHAIELFVLLGLVLHVIPQIPNGIVRIEKRTREPRIVVARLVKP